MMMICLIEKLIDYRFAHNAPPSTFEKRTLYLIHCIVYCFSS